MDTREKIKTWFYKGAYPTAEQFHRWLDSFVHKEDKIQISGVEKLSETLNNKADAKHAHSILTEGKYIASLPELTEDVVLATREDLDKTVAGFNMMNTASGLITNGLSSHYFNVDGKLQVGNYVPILYSYASKLQKHSIAFEMYSREYSHPNVGGGSYYAKFYVEGRSGAVKFTCVEYANNGDFHVSPADFVVVTNMDTLYVFFRVKKISMAFNVSILGRATEGYAEKQYVYTSKNANLYANEVPVFTTELPGVPGLAVSATTVFQLPYAQLSNYGTIVPCYYRKRTLQVVLSASGWDIENKQTFVNTAIGSNTTISIAPFSKSDFDTYGSAGIFASSTSANTLVFHAKMVPEENIVLNIIIED